jgi:hypothetical protein
MDEVVGRLIGGLVYRATPAGVSILDRNGTTSRRLDLAEIEHVERIGSRVKLFGQNDQGIELRAETTLDAVRLTEFLEPYLPVQERPASRPYRIGTRLALAAVAFVLLLQALSAASNLLADGPEPSDVSLFPGRNFAVHSGDGREISLVVNEYRTEVSSRGLHPQPRPSWRYVGVHLTVNAFGDSAIQDAGWVLRTVDGNEYARTWVSGLGESLGPVGEIVALGRQEG